MGRAYGLTPLAGFSIVRRMGKHDNRRSAKMRQRLGQKKLKARIKRRKTERAAARQGSSTKAPSKKKSAAAKE